MQMKCQGLTRNYFAQSAINSRENSEIRSQNASFLSRFENKVTLFDKSGVGGNSDAHGQSVMGGRRPGAGPALNLGKSFAADSRLRPHTQRRTHSGEPANSSFFARIF